MKIFKNFQKDYKNTLELIAISAITETTTNVNTTDYFTDRAGLKGRITDALRSALEPEGFTIVDVQIRKIDIPDSFDKVITSKLVAAQGATTELNRRNQTLVEAETEVIKGKFESLAATFGIY
jgi:regulator of protease activity HflC (stomatin/prohibitin superfamily)